MNHFLPEVYQESQERILLAEDSFDNRSGHGLVRSGLAWCMGSRVLRKIPQRTRGFCLVASWEQKPVTNYIAEPDRNQFCPALGYRIRNATIGRRLSVIVVTGGRVVGASGPPSSTNPGPRQSAWVSRPTYKTTVLGYSPVECRVSFHEIESAWDKKSTTQAL